MPSLDPRRDLLHERFREAFGEPHTCEGGGAQWSLRSSLKHELPVNIVITGWSETPGVWVFDPRDHVNGVQNTLITSVEQIDPFIETIRARLHPQDLKDRWLAAEAKSKTAAARINRRSPLHDDSVLHQHLRDRFREAFGAPHHSMGHDDHWRLESSPTLTLNVLVNGSPEKPAVWVFEPQTLDNGVMSRSINSRDDVETAITQIQHRLKTQPARKQ